ncbi:MAG: hypothetical protein GF364_05990 [Candidatus Lokiarchaeota archaeon]|nr:hypothetical protein [Candidatus Lokiarchaeota archaeon]
MSDFFKIYRKKGFEETLEVLYEGENCEYKESDFYHTLKTQSMHLNEFYRSKDDLLRYGVIGYKLDDSYDKVIFLTEKGKELKELVNAINELIKPKKNKKKRKK